MIVVCQMITMWTYITQSTFMISVYVPTVIVVYQYSNLQLMILLFIQQEGWAALHYASYEGHAEIAEVLVNYGADINVVTRAKVIKSMIVYFHTKMYVLNL